MSKRIALIDGYGFVFRAYFSLPPLTRKDGTPVGAVYGFTNMLIKLIASLDVSHVAVVFDSGSKTFRNDIYPDYKANRPPCPEDLKPQFPLIRESAESLNLTILEKMGFEADDIIATIAKRASREDYEVIIVSSDKDLMQLVNDKVSMYDAMKNKIIKEVEVKEKFQVMPNKVLDILALMGDASDNIPGVKGIGPKTAVELINQFGSLENIFENLDHITQDKRREYLTIGEENAKLSKVLASLKYDVDVGISDIDELKVKSINPENLINFLEEQGFSSLVSRVKKEFSITTNSPNKNAELATKKTEENSFKDVKKTEIKDLETFNNFYTEAKLNGIVTFDFYQNFITISTNKFNEVPSEIFYFEIALPKANQNSEQNDLFSFGETKKEEDNLTESFDVKILQNLFYDNSIKKVFFDAKNFFHKIYLPNFSNIFNFVFEDTLLINHLLNSSIKNNLDEIVSLNLGENFEEFNFGKILDEISKNKAPEIFLDKEKKIEFLTLKNFAVSVLYKNLNPQIFTSKLSEAYLVYEKPLIKTLARMENSGVKIDTKILANLSEEFGKKIDELTLEIHKISGEEFNIASTQQLSKILFEKLGLDSSKKSKKTGALSTGVKVLEELAVQGHEIANKILEFRKYSKLKNTYTDALPKEIKEETGRIHSNFSSTSTITGRLSSSNPNLQNIPIKTFEGRKIRKAFIAEKNCLLVSADYSQIELRVIAHIAKIDSLIEAFKQNKDIHKITASEVFKVPEDEVSNEMRSKAKAINFGIIYGISAFGLAKQLGISRTEAKDYIDSYLQTYPGIDSYMKEYIELARKNGFVQTLSGRKCFIRDINNKNPILRNEAERLSINAPIQGSASDIVKKAMILLDRKLFEQNIEARIILQIHDELIIETPEENAEKLREILKKEMEQAMMLNVPLKVDLAIGKNWE